MKKELGHLRRDSFMLRILIIAPIMQLIILGYALTFETRNVSLLICDMSRSQASRQLIQKIRTSDRFQFNGFADSPEELDLAVKQWKARVGLYFPPDFADRLKRGRKAQVLIYLDAVDGNQALTAFGYLQKILAGATPEVVLSGVPAYQTVQFNSHFIFNPELRNDVYMIPGVVVLLLTIVTTFMGGLSLVKELETGTLEHLMVTPITKFQLLAGKLLPYLIYAFLEMAVILFLAGLIFGIDVKGTYWHLYLFGTVFLFTTVGLGLLVSTIAHTQQQALFLAWFFMVFGILLSGFLIPIDNMPLWLQRITYLNPLRYMINAMREIFVKGTPIQYLYDQLLPLAVLGLTLFLISVARFRKRLS